MPESHLILGVDGGGTKTVAWLAPLDDATNSIVLGRGQAGPGNPRAAGFDVAQGNIALAVQHAFDDAKLPQTNVAAACFGLAGAGRAEEQRRIANWAEESGIANRVHVTGDAEPILAAAAGDNVGVALIAGTGSFAWGRNAFGSTARSGGWGYLIGDEGSGYAIALGGVRAAAQAADKRNPDTALLPALLKKLSINTPQDLIGAIYAPHMTRERLAELATVVFDLQATDATAANIIQAAAGDLAEMVAAVATQLRLPVSSYSLAASGGVFLNQSGYFDLVVNELATSVNARPGHALVVQHPAAGAVALARRLVQS
ncbi:MAG TPA: BadF/BadG/BcrA/BcrD ATPase family protein [Pirellulaceae bacterium]